MSMAAMKVLLFALLGGSVGFAGLAAANPVDRNLAYKSPFENKPHVSSVVSSSTSTLAPLIVAHNPLPRPQTNTPVARI